MEKIMHNRTQISLGLLLSIFVVGCANVPTPKVTVNDRSKNAVVTVKATTQNRDTVTVPANIPSVIYFEFDSFTIAKDQQRQLVQVAQFLKNRPGVKLVLEGHTDIRGTNEYNLSLGQKRSKSVGDILRLTGIQDLKLEQISYGEERPVDDGTSEAAHALNRRVELQFIKS
jgi:peptidoglycan-associated lipoprotein